MRSAKAASSCSSRNARERSWDQPLWRMHLQRRGSCARRRSARLWSCRASPMSRPPSSLPTHPSSDCRAPVSRQASRPPSRCRAGCRWARSGSTMPAASGSTAIPSAASARAASAAKACAMPWRSSRNGSSRACASTCSDNVRRSEKHMTWVGLIGCGGIAQDVVAALREKDMDAEVEIVGLLARPGRSEIARQKFPELEIFEAIEDLLSEGPDIIAEVASQQAVAEYGEQVLRDGIDLLVISIGALADAELYERLETAADAGNSRMLLPAGAIGGIDAITAMRIGGLSSVRYRSRKPPAAWRGSPAEKVVDLRSLAKPAVLYTGTAREAALLYPQNANVAAAVALAGLGFEETQVELVADPEAPGNVHEIEAEGAAGKFAIRLEGRPSRSNPKTSALAALSVARALLNEQAAIVI